MYNSFHMIKKLGSIVFVAAGAWLLVVGCCWLVIDPDISIQQV